jgi:DNA-binding CsgD family transcriptional regulator
VIAERIEAQVGGPEACQQLLENTYHQVLPEARSLVGILISPASMFRFLAAINPVVFPAIASIVEQLGEHRFRWTLTIRPGARPCRAWFNGTVGTIRGMPRHLGLPPAEVVAEISPHQGIYDVVLPQAPSRRSQVKSVTRSMLGRLVINLGYAEDGLGPGVVVGSIAALQSHVLGDMGARMKAIATHWELTAQQGKVLGQLIRGKSNKEIAVALGCAENTVELHVTNLFRKTGATSRTELVSLFWSAL